MKQLILVVSALGFSLNHVLGLGVEPLKPAFAQVFRCSDESLGEDEREETRGEDSRRESRVTIGTDCSDANFHEYLNERDRRGAESENQRRQDWREQSERQACQFYGIHSPNCTHEGLRRKAQQEQEVERQRQQESAQIQQEAQRENHFRQRVAAAQSEVRKIQESIIFWSDKPEMRQDYEKKLPLAEADLQRAEQELQSYLNQRNGS